MIRSFLHKSSTSGIAGVGIQPHASLVLGHNYEQNGDDVTGNYPLGWANGTSAYANNWAAQGYGLTNFGSGGLSYFVNSAMNAVLEASTWTIAWHLRTGSNVATDSMLVGDGSTFAGFFFRINSGFLIQTNGGGINISYAWNPTINTNYHIALTYQSSDFARLYINGTEVASSATTGQPTAGGTQYKLGHGLHSGYQIYDFGIWNINMNSTQVGNIRNNLAP